MTGNRGILALPLLVLLLTAGPARPGEPPAGSPPPTGDMGLVWARDWDEAARRSRDEKKLVMVLVELYSGLDIPEMLPLLFLDPDLHALLRTRFVGLRWERGMKAPFQERAVWGMGPYTFGMGVLYATPEGRIVGQCPAASVHSLEAYSLGLLGRFPEFNAPPLPADPDPLARAEAHLARGEMAEAGGLLEKPDSSRGWRLRAGWLRRLHKGDEALTALREAGAGADPSATADLRSEEGLVLIRMGRFDEARKVFAGLLESHPSYPRAAEVKYWIACIDLRSDPEKARKALQDLVGLGPNEPWAKKLDLILRQGDLAQHALWKATWPTESMLDVIRDVPPQLFPAEKLADAERGAVEYLLKAQQPDGSWIMPYHLGAAAFPFAIAATSICASSLIPFRERKEAAAAVDRGLEFVLKAQKDGTLTREAQNFGFNYAMWGRGFAMRLLARCVRGGVGDGERVKRALKGFIGETVAQENAQGGWTYYGEMVSSFQTAVVVLALQEARAAGMEVPPAAEAGGLKALQGMRVAPGVYRYFRGSGPNATEGSLRGPLCSLALCRGGKADPIEIRAALDVYLKCRRETRSERGKSLCHTSPEGVSSYFLLFGYVFAAESLAELPEKDRDVYREALREDVLASRLGDGSFLDFPPVGRHYGTGMALAAMAHLGGAPAPSGNGH